MPGEETGIGRMTAMKHPRSRTERRHMRLGWMSRRRYIIEHVWRSHGWKPQWGRFAKWNLNCGCRSCHYSKYGGRRKRRRSLDLAVARGLVDYSLPPL